MMRRILGIVAGLVAWTCVATAGNLIVRVSWPAYMAVEASMRFTLAMMIARLALGALSSVCAGLAVARIVKGDRTAVVALGIILVGLFVPVHYGLWDRFPVWYHVVFLASLFPLVLLGATLNVRSHTPARAV